MLVDVRASLIFVSHLKPTCFKKSSAWTDAADALLASSSARDSGTCGFNGCI